MTNINKSFEKIVNPTSDFMFSEDLLKNNKYMKAVYDKIFVEITRFVEKMPKVTIQACSLRRKPKSLFYVGKIRCESKKHQYVVSTTFRKEIVEVIINDKNLGEAVIFGAKINKVTLSPSNIKVDLATFKKSLSEIIN